MTLNVVAADLLGFSPAKERSKKEEAWREMPHGWERSEENGQTGLGWDASIIS